ncbi:TGS domain-containing protein [Microbacterium sp. PM5]|uniref:TGS domain-containing protein n=1 Tax=Microbacterium sp. PM5 TaxID=2014534 RepID=UPI0013AF0219|nr:TGS domain-containing protein [Microbacterium sp. PM5]
MASPTVPRDDNSALARVGDSPVIAAASETGLGRLDAVDRAVSIADPSVPPPARAATFPSPSTIARGYLDLMVVAASPRELVNRDQELRAIAEFVKGDYAVMGWEGREKSGKTELLRAVVARGLPDTRVIPFFIDSARAGMDDVRAFASIAGAFVDDIIGRDSSPRSAELAHIPQLFMSALTEAARLTEKAGQRLLLVIDGLDEDAAMDPGLAQRPSIASLLPADYGSIPANVRILVSRRPAPPLPPDVAHGHWLRDGSNWRTLSPLAIADSSIDPREVDHLMSTSLGTTIAALILAAEGPLTVSDLAILAPAPVTQVEQLLAQRTTRNLIPVQFAGRVGFQLGHATTAERIVQNLSPALRDLNGLRDLERWHNLRDEVLSPYRKRISAVVDECITMQWNLRTTPYYLATDAFVLSELERSENRERLIAILTDPARRAWVREVSGSDAIESEQYWQVLQRLSPRSPLDVSTFDALTAALDQDDISPSGLREIGSAVRAARTRRDPSRESTKLVTESQRIGLHVDLYRELLRRGGIAAIAELSKFYDATAWSPSELEALANAIAIEDVKPRRPELADQSPEVIEWWDRIETLADIAASKRHRPAGSSRRSKTRRDNSIAGVASKSESSTHRGVSNPGSLMQELIQLAAGGHPEEALVRLDNELPAGRHHHEALAQVLPRFFTGRNSGDVLRLIDDRLVTDGRDRAIEELSRRVALQADFKTALALISDSITNPVVRSRANDAVSAILKKRDRKSKVRMRLGGEGSIVVNSPAGKRVRLPRDATPVDYAFAIHTELGERIVTASVNGAAVSLDWKLQDGDKVEVVADARHGAPSLTWLASVKTSRARNRIRRWHSTR